MYVDLKVLVVVLSLMAMAVRCADNATATAAPAATRPPPATTKHESGALASFGKMLLDIPLGFVEACKDGVAAIEKTFLAIVRGLL